jgi:hypothetical protein
LLRRKSGLFLGLFVITLVTSTFFERAKHKKTTKKLEVLYLHKIIIMCLLSNPKAQIIVTPIQEEIRVISGAVAVNPSDLFNPHTCTKAARGTFRRAGETADAT